MAKRSMFFGGGCPHGIDRHLARGGGRKGEVRHYGVITGDWRLWSKSSERCGPRSDGCGSYMRRAPAGLRFVSRPQGKCVVNPSSMPKRSGNRIKWDWGDGATLARLRWAEELTAIYFPTPAECALRDLAHARPRAICSRLSDVDSLVRARRVRICANKVVAGARFSPLPFKVRLTHARQLTSAHQIRQLEGLAVAISWGFESPLPHQPNRIVFDQMKGPSLLPAFAL